MHYETFALERLQSLYENTVPCNLTESGVHPFSLRELLPLERLEALLDCPLDYGQTNGLIPLREAIAALYPGSTLGPDHVLVTNGSAEANFVAAHSLLHPGDEVVMMWPNYLQLWGVMRAMNVSVKPFHLREDRNWAPDLDELRAQVSPHTRMICLCHPNNPTGATLSAAEMTAIVDLAREVGAWLYVDEVYRGAELDGQERPSFLGRYEKTVVAGGLSKAYALPGLRIGWLAGPAGLIEKAWSYHDYTSITAGRLSNEVAIDALQPALRARILERNRALLRQNLATFENWAAAQPVPLTYTPPQAGGMLFVRYGLDLPSQSLSDYLRREQGVFVVPGHCFGLEHFLRLGIGAAPAQLADGLARISRGWAQLGSP